MGCDRGSRGSNQESYQVDFLRLLRLVWSEKHKNDQHNDKFSHIGAPTGQGTEMVRETPCRLSQKVTMRQPGGRDPPIARLTTCPFVSDMAVTKRRFVEQVRSEGLPTRTPRQLQIIVPFSSMR